MDPIVALETKFEEFLKQNPQFDRDRHGGLYDRGRADSYYRRGASPHWYPQGTYKGEAVTDLSPDEVLEYMEGFDDNERFGDFKEWV